VQKLAEPSLKASIFKGNAEEAKVISLNDVSLFHFHIAELAEQGDLICVYYRGALGGHEKLGWGRFPLPEVSAPALTWTLTKLEDTNKMNQRFICQFMASPIKQKDCIATYIGSGKPLFLSVAELPPGRTIDDKVPELYSSIREFLQMLDKRKPNSRGN
jgi:hypothetical protein